MHTIMIEDLSDARSVGALEVAAEVYGDDQAPVISMLAALGVPQVLGHSYLAGVTHRRYWVAVVDGKVAGTIGLYAEEDDDTAIWINWFMVSASFRRRGVGTALLQHAIQAALARRSEQPSLLWLRLWTSDREREADAQRLYDRMGFAVVDSAQSDYWQGAPVVTRQLALSSTAA